MFYRTTKSDARVRFSKAHSDSASIRWLEQIQQDVSYALRQWRRSPTFSLAVVLTLACGVGANTAVFTATDALLLKSLAVQHPEELVQLDSFSRENVNTLRGFSYHGFEILKKAGAPVVSGMFAYTDEGTSSSVNQTLANSTILYRGNATTANGMLASTNIYEVLGVRPAIGRLFVADDGLVEGQAPVIVLSYNYWQARFGGDNGIIGQILEINGFPLAVIGVTEPNFRGVQLGYSPDFNAPLSMADALHAGNTEDASSWWLSILARKRPGVTDRRLEASLASAFRATVDEFVQSTPAAVIGDIRKMVRGLTLQVRPANEGGVVVNRDELRRSFTYLGLIAAMLLCIACVNLANLLFARATTRQCELWVRTALGAGPARMFRQLLTEITTLVFPGSVAALTIGFWGGPILLKLLAGDSITGSLDVSPDWRVFVFTGCMACVCGICLSFIPGLQLASTGLSKAANQGRGSGPKAPELLIIVQVALILLLSVGAGLFVRSFQKIHDIDPGFRTDDVLALKISNSALQLSAAREQQFITGFCDGLKRLPDIKSVSFATSTPGRNDSSTFARIHGEGRDLRTEPVGANFVGPQFFETVGINLVAGRRFTANDGLSARLVAIVDEAFVRRFLNRGNPLSRRFTLLGDDSNAFEIVGVVRDVKEHGVLAAAPLMLYLPYQQHAGADVSFFVRTSGEPSRLAPEVRRILKQINPGIALSSIETLKVQIDELVSRRRVLAQLSTVMGSLAVALASIGLYGTFAYRINRQTKEIAIRMAVGAVSSTIVWEIYRRVLWVVFTGIAIGLLCLLPSVHVLRSFLYGVAPTDPASILGSAAIICLVASIAVYFPAQRAGRVDPAIVLRNE